MTTEITKYVDTGGLDEFPSANAAATWIEANYTDLTASGSDVNITVIGRASGGAADTTPLDLGAITSDNTHKVTFKVAAGQEHDGLWDTSKYRLDVSGSNFAIKVTATYCDFEDISARLSAPDAANPPVIYTGSESRNIFRRVRAELTASLSDGRCFVGNGDINGLTQIFDNCLAEGNNIAGSGFIFTSSYRTSLLRNCTARNCERNFSSESSVSTICTVINCLAIDGTTDFYATTTFNSASDYNVSEDSSAPGSNATPSATVSFVGSTAQPVAGCDADGAGTNLSAYFTTDIAGTTRTTPWDVGAFVAAVASSNNDATVTLNVADIIAGILANTNAANSGDVAVAVADIAVAMAADTNAANTGAVGMAVDDIPLAIAADVNQPNTAVVAMAVDDIDISITATLEEQGLTIHTLLDFSNSADLGHDSSGNGNDWTLASASQSVDTPTGNYATLNPLSRTGGTVQTFSDGLLKITGNGATNPARVPSSISVESGKWYVEMVNTNSNSSANYKGLGLTTEVASKEFNSSDYSGQPTSSGASATEWMLTDEGVACNGTTYSDLSSIIGEILVDDVVQMAVDVDLGKVWFGINNTWSGSPASGTGEAFGNVLGTVRALAYCGWAAIEEMDFGQNGYMYSPPTGFIALAAENIGDDEYSLSGSYTGNGSTDGTFVHTGCALESVTIGGTTYDNDGTDSAVVIFTSCGFKLVSTTQNANGTTYNWTGVLLTSAKYSNAQ